MLYLGGSNGRSRCRRSPLSLSGGREGTRADFYVGRGPAAEWLRSRSTGCGSMKTTGAGRRFSGRPQRASTARLAPRSSPKERMLPCRSRVGRGRGTTATRPTAPTPSPAAGRGAREAPTGTTRGFLFGGEAVEQAVETLRGPGDSVATLAAERDRFLAEVERLRAEVEDLRLNAQHDEEETVDLLDQRDALADALLNLTGRVAGESFCEICGVDTPGHAEDCSVPASLEALRLAGRLP